MVPLTVNEYTVKDSFSFADEIRLQESNYIMASLDVDSLFTNIPLQETNEICVNQLFTEPTTTVNGLLREEFRRLLEFCSMESFFLFNDNYYKQVDGVAMGSPLGPTLANAFMCYYERKWLEECPSDFKPKYYKRYVDDIFVLFSSSEHVDSFLSYMNSKHPNIHFTKEVENNNSLSFLDVLTTREGSNFITDVYRKPTFSGVFTNFTSFLPIYFKHGLIYSLLFRSFRICSDFSRFHAEVDNIKKILSRNSYPNSVIDFCIRTF